MQETKLQEMVRWMALRFDYWKADRRSSQGKLDHLRIIREHQGL